MVVLTRVAFLPDTPEQLNAYIYTVGTKICVFCFCFSAIGYNLYLKFAQWTR